MTFRFHNMQFLNEYVSAHCLSKTLYSYKIIYVLDVIFWCSGL
jgi:hypothetical protein